ncbi:1-phosphatidylinositol-3-phosphate 5-kinase FAB1A [Hibiscus syriacus]|uniref:1-phosphatidylinositol-3-phosphate 5-kinase n=1 Tax=Hibiscus syriacus TaxID=106335 RepID=A0A6A2ZDL0_HIBSY|nr:1-phosphatidylinositol-3-phosphate 5-kinase FAB1B-like [Hibiscus syriacus]KAE8689489.1 1-phosphatidylinositol-3-phosphate 5-kinase FAB1A [Hibiscus syriacus]
MNEDSRNIGRWMMEASNNTFSQVVSLLKSWIPWRSEPANVSVDFWMPDHSCRVCYDCDAQFTLFNRRHHCRLCGRVFCAKCTANSVPAPSYDPMIPLEEQETVRVCDYCFNQWRYGLITNDGRVWVPNQDFNSSMLARSFTRTKSGGLSSVPYQGGQYQHLHHRSILSPRSAMKKGMRRPILKTPRFSKDLIMDAEDPSSSQYEFSWNSIGLDGEDDEYNSYLSDFSEDNGYYTPLSFDEMSKNDGSHKFHSDEENVDSKSSERLLTEKVWIDDEDNEYRLYLSDSETLHYSDDDGYYTPTDFDEISNDDDEPQKVHPDGENIDSKSLSSSPVNQVPSPSSEGISQSVKKDEHDGDECEALPSLYPAEPVDFENDGPLWLPPEPEDEDDEKEAALFDDEDDTDGAGDWGYWHKTSSFGSGESRSRDKSTEEQKKVTKNIVDGHFRALIAQLLQVENLPVGDENSKDSWLEIITALSWEAASLLKPYTTKGGEMDPGGYVKVKCIASGYRNESMVVKGVVCKKNVAHRRMTSKLEKPRLMILGGALEYQRVSNLLSSFDTLLLQEMDHLKMAVAKIHAHKPHILLVEKSVSRFAQEYLLEKDISLVLNIKRSLLERIARCTGAQIIPSIDHLFSQKLGYCEKFHVERFREDFGSPGQGGKKLAKTLMYFEGCPKPLGCTIILRGANGDELKKIKHVVQYGIFASYHLALETSFLADEGASLPEFPNSPMAVALPDKPSTIARSISTVPDFATANIKSQGPQHFSGPQRANSVLSAIVGRNIQKIEEAPASFSSKDISLWSVQPTLKESSALVSSTSEKTPDVFSKKSEMGTKDSSMREISVDKNKSSFMNSGVRRTESSAHMNSEATSVQQDGKNHNNQSVSKPLKEVFPSAPSDNQSILVSLSSRSVRKGTVCERSHLFRIKYYGSFDKPLGRFLRDHLFDQSYRCPSCDLPSEAHVHCYTHRQGTLTMSVKKLTEIFLPGEKEGKIWMWHRCLQCPRTNGFPPATFRRVMSDAAWGLSFGKFLELSFSNHAAASRVASCGHSLHRDCLRFYGFGRMVACFRYATIDVHSVCLPPPKLEFYHESQKWIQQETDKVTNQAELLFSKVLKFLNQIAEKQTSSGPPGSDTKTSDLRDQITELEGILHNEKLEFDESMQKASEREVRKGQHVVDILEINRLRRQLLFQSYMWDQRLVFAAKLENYIPRNCFSNLITGHEEKPVIDIEKVKDMDTLEHGKGSESGDSTVVDAKLNANQSDAVHQEPDMNKSSNCGNKDYGNISASQSMFDQYDNEKPKANVRRAMSEGQFPVIENLSDTLDAAWTGEIQRGPVLSKKNSFSLPDIAAVDLEDRSEENIVPKVICSPSPTLFNIGSENMEEFVSWLKMPFLSFYRSSSNKNFLGSSSKLDTLKVYDRFNISSFRELELQGGDRLLLPVGVNDTVIPVYDDELTSTISYALVSPEYHFQISDERDRPKDWGDSMASSSFSDSVNFQLAHSVDNIPFYPQRSFGSADDLAGSRSSLIMDPPSSMKSLHVRVSFGEDGSDKVKYTVTCYYAKWFETLRKVCCPSELDFIRSLSRCKKWGAQGGKSNVFFAKTLDDRFIIKQVTKTELESFIKLAPKYFNYLSEAIRSRSPTCLAKILGVYQVTRKQPKGGKESRMDVLVMENLLFRRNVTRLYDLKGSSRSRYNPDSSGSNKVLLDQNLIESMPTNPIFVGNKAKRVLERAVWNDTAFLASNDLMDYSLLLGVDEEKHELVIGIIDFLRQYTWDKHLETWVKASGILGGPKNASPTVISPEQYKKRFRKAMSTYFLMIPDQWSPPTVPSKSESDTGQEKGQRGASAK